jgi:hypothetical protein
MTQEQSSKNQFLPLLLCLVGVLLALFHNSLIPARILFSNDGPLGAMNQQAVRLPAAFRGVWYDLNSLGNSGGTSVPDLSQGLFWLFGPLYFAKWYVPLVALFVGLCAWFCFRQLKLSALACVLGGLAAALNSDFFSTACWGVGAQTIGFGFEFLALAALVSAPPRWPWLRLPLAGLAVGLGVMEAADIGAIFSVFVAAFVLYHAWVSESTPARRVGFGLVQVVVVAGFAAFIAAQTISVQIGTAIKGVAGAQDTEAARAQRWDWATQWSLPKREALSLIVPGLFGYRMDTPNGGNYWGAAGRAPAWDRYFESGEQGPPPRGFIRFAGGGAYAGVLVVLVAIWAGVQSFRKKGSVFSSANRKLIWFWLGVLFVSLLLALGRYAPFYRLFYALPHASAIRNPAKFLHVFSWALLIMFAYGIHGLSRRYLEVAAANTGSLPGHLKKWWAKVRGFDQKWTLGCALAIAASLLGWLIYASARTKLEAYLQTVQFDEGMAKAIASFSFRAVGWYILFLILAVGLVTAVLSGWFAGKRAKLGGILLGVLLVVDLGRANLPWIVYWNYKEKYATNPVVDFLRKKPYEHRVAIFSMSRYVDVRRLPREAEPLLRLDGELSQLYSIEWAQHLFLYYDIQSLDVIQEPRTATDKAAYEAALAFAPLRRWQLSNTRYLLAPTALLDFLDRQFDPVQHRFRIALRFNIVPKPGVENPTRYEDLTATLNTNGQCAVFEFTGALPRAKLYANWQVSTNDPAKLQDWAKEFQEQLRKHVQKELADTWCGALASQNPTDLATLKELAEPSFNPGQTVLLAEAIAAKPGTNQDAGTVQYESYAPTHIVLRAKASAPAVLLLNDKFDPSWKVSVDGQPEKLLRCNFIMRGVYLKAGDHTVEFKFEPSLTGLYVSLSAIGVGVILLGIVIFGNRRDAPSDRNEAAGGPKKERASKR